MTLFSPQLVWATIGSCALVFLSAFESLAVTTIMPTISEQLGGASFYALAFSGPLATGVIGMVFAGGWADRHGPVAPLLCAVGSFVAGLIIAGTAENMVQFIGGRLAQGVGGGALTVALYVLVARIYPAVLHPKIFAGFAAAWVIPSLIGPYIAGKVAVSFGWNWVFLGVVGLVLIATLMVLPVLRMLRPATSANDDPAPQRWEASRILWAVLAAAAVLGLSLSTQLDGWMLVIGGSVAIVVSIVAVRPLLPRGSLLVRRGLPSVIAMRGLVAAAFFGAEVYIPYFLISVHHFDPEYAGLSLTAGALAWALGSAVQGRLGDKLPSQTSVLIGAILVLCSIVSVFVSAVLSLPALVIIVGWTIAGGGMGLIYPRLSTLTLAYSSPHNQGFNSSAMSIVDSLGAGLALAGAGIVFTAFSGPTGEWSFVSCFALAALLAVVGLFVAPRVVGRSLA